MTKGLLSSIFVLVISYACLAQSAIYHPMPDSDAAWNFDYNHTCSYGGFGDDYYSMTISGDTVIGANIYHKLYVGFVDSSSASSCSRYKTGHKGAFRQDTFQRKVFYIPRADSIEYLLYDFTMQVGDTVRGYIEKDLAPYPDIVHSMDSVLVGTKYRKRWHINNSYGIYLIEGIGSTYGLIETSLGEIADGGLFWLLCFQQGGQPLYPDTISSCEMITSINNHAQSPLTICPNPNNGNFSVRARNMNGGKFQLLDIRGALLKEYSINSEEVHIADPALRPGIYFIRFAVNEYIGLSQKLVIIE